MLTTDQINDLHRLYWSERWPIRKIEQHLRMGWHTIKKYLDAPAQGPAQRQRDSKLDPFKATLAEWLEKDPTATAAVLEQRLRPLGYRGGHSILRAYVHTVRPQLKPSRAFLRMEPPPGERFEVDWGHFGILDYASDKRKLYARPGGSAQPHAVPGVHPQPEFRNLRPLSRACVHGVGRRCARNRL